MQRYDDLTGMVFGRLTVMERDLSDKKVTRWLCRCECGTIKSICAASLKSGSTVSCGCWSRENTRNRSLKHGDTNTRLYSIWRGMKKRCYQTTSYGYKNYGGRGILVCDEWKDSYETFKKWALQNGYREDLTLDRIDNDGHYEPSNCRFSTYLEQENNRRSNRKIAFNGVALNSSQWCRLTNTPPSTFQNRINRAGEQYAVRKSLEEFKERVT